MQKSFVVVAVDLFKAKGHNQEFEYRGFVNNELFVERSWIWDDQFYIEEFLQIEAPAGEYKIHFTAHSASPEVLKVKNIRVVDGKGKIVEDNLILE